MATKTSLLARLRRELDPLSRLQLTIVVVFFLFFMIAPIANIILNAFLHDGSLSIFWFDLVFKDKFFWSWEPTPPAQFIRIVGDTLYITGIDFGVIPNTFFVAILTTAFSTILGTTVAFVMARYDFQGKTAIRALLLIPLISSPFVGAIGIKKLIAPLGSLNLLFYDTLHVIPYRIVLDGLMAVIFVQTLHFFALVYINAYTSIISIDPTMEEQAENLGAKGFRLWRTVTFPLSLPGIQAGAILTFILSIEDLGTPIIFQDSAQATKLLTFQVFSNIFAEGGVIDPLAPTLSVILLVTAMLGFVAVRKYVSLRQYAMISKGGAWRPRVSEASSRLKALVYLFLILLLGLAFIPHIGVGLLAVADKWGQTILPSSYDFSNMLVIFKPEIAGSIINSFTYSLSATLIIIIIGTGAAYVIARKNIPGKSILDLLVTMPIAIPGIVIAIGFYTAFLGTPLSPLINPAPILILAYTVRKMPFLIRASFAGLQQTHVALEEASLSVGAGRVNTFFRITIPLIAISILAGSMLAFIYSMTEVSTSLILGGVKPALAPVTWKMFDLYWAVGGARFDAPVLGLFLIIFQVVAITLVSYILKARASLITGI